MRFFRRHDRSSDEPAEPHTWQESGLAEEVEAFLAGRLADVYAGAGRAMPAWVALNRLAHANRAELVHLVAGERLNQYVHPSFRTPDWKVTERFVAGSLLARARTSDELAAIQRDALVPVELALIGRSKIDRLTAEQVIEAGAEALDTRHPGS